MTTKILIPSLQMVTDSINEKVSGVEARIRGKNVQVFDNENRVLLDTDWYVANYSFVKDVESYFGQVWQQNVHPNLVEVEKTRDILKGLGYTTIDSYDFLLHETREVRHVLIQNDHVVLTIMDIETENFTEQETLHRYITRSRKFIEN